MCYYIDQSSKPGFFRKTGPKGLPELQNKKNLILNFTAVSLFMIVTSLTGTTTPVKLPDVPRVENTVSEATVVKPIPKKKVEAMMSTEQYVRKYFKDIPVMIEIARCESTFRQLDDDGDVHRGNVVPEDVGVMQINEHYHLDQAIKKDINIYTLDGNLEYARDLYERQGTQPWNSSKPCWGKYESRNLALNSTNQ